MNEVPENIGKNTSKLMKISCFLGLSMSFMVLILFTKSWLMTIWRYGYPRFYVHETIPIVIAVETVLCLLAVIFTGKMVYSMFLELRLNDEVTAK